MIYATIIYEKKAEWSPTVKEIHDNIVQDLYTQEQKNMLGSFISNLSFLLY